MARARFHMQTSLTPERVLPMPPDFSQCRPELWPTLVIELNGVYEVHPASADVKSEAPSVGNRDGRPLRLVSARR
jgi:hypothetical protein